MNPCNPCCDCCCKGGRNGVSITATPSTGSEDYDKDFVFDIEAAYCRKIDGQCWLESTTTSGELAALLEIVYDKEGEERWIALTIYDDPINTEWAVHDYEATEPYTCKELNETLNFDSGIFEDSTVAVVGSVEE